jgi:hypothetical protein
MNIENRQWADVTRSQCASANLSRNGTAEIGNRDKLKPRRLIGLNFAVSGSDSDRTPCQNPAEARVFLGLSLVASAKSLQLQTGWRRVQSGANSSLGARP